MEPRIQYAKTSDGVSIAFWTLGKGRPLVYMPFLVSTHAQLGWRNPARRDWFERLAQGRQLIGYDCRGAGLSDRTVGDYSVDALVLDLEAVVKRSGLEEFALFAPARSGPVAVTYAVRHPERISHLLLWCSRVSEAYAGEESPRMRAVRSLVEQDWELFTETYAHEEFGWSAGEEAHNAAAFMRESITPEVFRAYDDTYRNVDITDMLSLVKAPTLVFQVREAQIGGLERARVLASLIPDARLAVIEGKSGVPYRADAEATLLATDEFLGAVPEPPVKSDEPAARDVHTILFTDMESSTALTRQLGDAAAQEVRRNHNEIVRAALSENDGSEIKHTGDGIMASFSTASAALECAIAIQRGVAAHVDEHPETPLSVYIGLNAGEPIAEEQDLFGTSVDLAARICDRAEPGQILASDVVRQLAAGKDFLFADLGETELRGFEDPVKVWEVRWREEPS